MSAKRFETKLYQVHYRKEYGPRFGQVLILATSITSACDRVRGRGLNVTGANTFVGKGQCAVTATT